MSSSFMENYFVLNKIGAGSFADVVKCQSINSHEYYAAKVLRKRFKSAVDAESCAEVTASMRLRDHPNILRLIDVLFDSAPRKLTLIFELMDMSMHDLIRKRTRPIPEARARRQVMQILNALSYMHQNGLFHRDVKPENILLRNADGANGHGEEGEVIKLADLGSAKSSYDRRPHTEYISTRWYRSPECLLTAGYYGPKMDVWSTGCVYYELLTLRPLFPGDSELDQLQRIHAVLGTPRRRLLDRFAMHKSRNLSFSFAECTASGLRVLLPAASDDACRLLRMMLIYDPAFRLNVKRLLEDSYFKSLRESEGFPRIAAKSTDGIIKSEPNSSKVTYRLKKSDVKVHKSRSVCEKSSPPSKKSVYLSAGLVTDRPVLRRLKAFHGKCHDDGVPSNINAHLKNKNHKRTRQIAGMNIVSPRSSTDNPGKKLLLGEINSTSKDTIRTKEKSKVHNSFNSSDTVQHSRSVNFIEKIKPKCKNVCLPLMHDFHRNSKSISQKTIINISIGSNHKNIILPSIHENFVQELGAKKNF